MNAGLIALLGAGVLGAALLATNGGGGDAITKYNKYTSGNILEEMDENTDLLAVADDLLSQGYANEAAELREMHYKLYAPHLTPEEIQNQIQDWKNLVTDLYGVEWQ